MKRRSTLTLLAALAVLATLITVRGADQANATEAQAEHLGTPIHQVTTPGGAYGPGPNGEEYFYTVASGRPAYLYVLDARTGERVTRFALEGADGAWALTVAPDGTLYVGTYFTASLFRWKPGSDSIQNLGQPVAGKRFLWSLDTDDQGRVYGGSEGNGFRYDPQTGKFRDYGQITSGENYVRNVAYARDTVYWGIGDNPHLVAMNPESGEKREIALPDDLYGPPNSFVYDLDYEGGRLFVRVESSRTLLVYDPASGELLDRIDNTYGLSVSPRGPKDSVYFIKDGVLTAYDVLTEKLTSTGFRPTPKEGQSHARGYGWAHFDTEEWPGPTLVSMTVAGDIWWYNPQTKRSKKLQADIVAEPVVVRSMGLGPDDKLYMGGYFSGGLGIYDPATSTLSERRDIGQVESFTSHNGKLYAGVYPWAYLLSYDPDQPWEYFTNPKEHFHLHEQGQSRPLAMTPIGDEIAIGTSPDYGQSAGALTFFNPGTGERVVRRDLGNHAVAALATRDGKLYGGTQSYQSGQDAKLLVVDPATREQVWEGVSVPGQGHISDLSFDAAGLLWGITSSGVAFAWDPSSRTVVKTQSLFPNDSWDPDVDQLLWWSFLEYDAATGGFYGSSKGNLFRLDPETMQTEVLNDEAYLFGRDACGDLYFSRGADLYRHDLPEASCA